MTKTILITGAFTGFWPRHRRNSKPVRATRCLPRCAIRRPRTVPMRTHSEVRTSKSSSLMSPILNRLVEQSATIITKAGRIDVLINNAGLLAAGVSEAFTPEQVTALFDVNVSGLHRVTRAVLPHLRRHNDGLIINIGSIVVRVTFPFSGLYGASKFAVEALTDSYRYEISQLGIDVGSCTTQRLPDAAVCQCDSASRHGAGDRVRHPGGHPCCHVRAVQHHAFRA